jgi:hypothetical protein
MTDERPQRISIGFIGGQSLTARLKADDLVKLRQALGSVGWHEHDLGEIERDGPVFPFELVPPDRAERLAELHEVVGLQACGQ